MDFLTVIHIIIAIILILLVLVQDSKGAMGGTFGGGGGGSHTLFGATGVENVLTKSTKTVVIFFAITCILLTRLSSQNRESVLDTEGHRPTQPIQQETQPTAPTQTNQTETTQTKATQADGNEAVPAESVPPKTEEAK